MTGDLKRYSAMKDSGVPWLGDVPEHWGVHRLKQLCSRSALYGANLSAANYASTGVRFIRTTDITDDGSLKEGGVFVPSDSVREYSLAAGDLLISRSGTIGRSFLYEPSHHGPCAYAGYLVRFVPSRAVLPKFLFLFTKSKAFSGYLSSVVISSTIDNVNGQKYANCPVPVPPPEEQALIVQFLDYVNRRIRHYILTKRELIRVLGEQKQSIIELTVTRGLNSNVRLKTTGVEWLDYMPQHWSAARLKFMSSDIVDCLHATPVYSDDGTYPAIRTADVTPGALLLSSARRVDEGHYHTWTQRMAPAEEDILYTREGERFGIAALVPPNVQLCISQRMMALRIRDEYNSEYIMWQINCQHVYAQAACDLIGAAAPHVNVERIKNFWLLIPPRSEQDEIVAEVKRKVSGIDAAIRRARDAIRFFGEYRTRLIADVATGKLDVREAVANLPDEVGEPDDLPLTDEMLEDVSESELASGGLAGEEPVG